ncbi:MAG: MarR family transcriptional regulator [Actinomycetales bacterium]|nr:MarR family transcriptional regulator [Candidatus Phosphoribacter baldrii]
MPKTETHPRYAAGIAHGANVLRALAHAIDSLGDSAARTDFTPPLDHVSARDALTLLSWRGRTPAPAIEEALGLSQSACVRLLDRLQAAGLIARDREPRDRRVWVTVTPEGEHAARRIIAATSGTVEALVSRALPDASRLIPALEVLDLIAMAAAGDAVDPSRFCRACDPTACLAEGQACPSDRACDANSAAS